MAAVSPTIGSTQGLCVGMFLRDGPQKTCCRRTGLDLNRSSGLIAAILMTSESTKNRYLADDISFEVMKVAAIKRNDRINIKVCASACSCVMVSIVPQKNLLPTHRP